MSCTAFFKKYRFCICKYVTDKFSDHHYPEWVLAKLLYLCFLDVPVFYSSGKTKMKTKSSLKMGVFKEMFSCFQSSCYTARKGKKKKRVEQNDPGSSKSIDSKACLCFSRKNYSCRARLGSNPLQKSHPSENAFQKAVLEGTGF